MTDDAPRRYDFRVIPIDAIDPPAHAMREEMDDAALADLAANIKRNGLLQPLGVVPTGDRFRISWGHRRYEAAKLAGELELPCRVLFNDDVREEEFKYVENTFREAVNPMAEASWLAELLEHKYGGYLDRLCAALGLKQSTVEDRLDLLRGWPEVQEALRSKQIRLGVARELNRMKDHGWAKYRLSEAIEQGATERVVRQWRIDDQKTLATQQMLASGEVPAVPPSTEAQYGSVDTCVLCMLPEDQHDMDYVKVHRDCVRQLMRRVRAEQRQQAAADQ